MRPRGLLFTLALLGLGVGAVPAATGAQAQTPASAELTVTYYYLPG